MVALLGLTRDLQLATRRLWTASRDGGAEERFGGDGRIAVSPY